MLVPSPFFFQPCLLMDCSRSAKAIREAYTAAAGLTHLDGLRSVIRDGGVDLEFDVHFQSNRRLGEIHAKTRCMVAVVPRCYGGLRHLIARVACIEEDWVVMALGVGGLVVEQQRVDCNFARGNSWDEVEIVGTAYEG